MTDEKETQRVYVTCKLGSLRAARVKAAEEAKPLAVVLGEAIDKALQPRQAGKAG